MCRPVSLPNSFGAITISGQGDCASGISSHAPGVLLAIDRKASAGIGHQ
jgi:hypothetical protein